MIRQPHSRRCVSARKSPALRVNISCTYTYRKTQPVIIAITTAQLINRLRRVAPTQMKLLDASSQSSLSCTSARAWTSISMCVATHTMVYGHVRHVFARVQMTCNCSPVQSSHTVIARWDRRYLRAAVSDSSLSIWGTRHGHTVGWAVLDEFLLDHNWFTW